MGFFWTIVALIVTLGLAWRYIGSYMAAVFEGRVTFLAWLERPFYRLLGTSPDKEQSWKRYAGSVVIFSGIFLIVGYVLMRIQGSLPLNPQHFGGVTQALNFNTVVSFVTNTNWQNYGGETAMSYFTQIGVLTVQQFVSAAVGIAVAIALVRGFSRRSSPTIGNFWVDITRCMLYILLPVAFVAGVIAVASGAVQTLAGPVNVHDALNGVTQTIPRGPAGFMGSIMQLGTNGGGFFNANAAHPFENPTPFTNFLSLFMIFAVSSALTYTYGRMARDQRHGWAVWGAMAILFVAGVAVCYPAEAQANTAFANLPVDQAAGNKEGKEARFGVAASALYATVTTDASCGAVNSMHDSFTPIGGLVPLANIQLGEVVFGGTGAGLYGMLVYVVLTVFIAGLMVGRTPEYLGKKIEGREMKLAMLYVLIFPLVILGFSAWSAVSPYGLSSLNNGGPRGLMEILYAYSSGAGNNGSAYAGLNANTPWYNVSLGLDMLAGRFLMIVPALGIAGSMVGKKVVPPSLGTFPTNGSTFAVLLVSVVVIVGALTFFPALSLGNIIEHFAAVSGKVF